MKTEIVSAIIGATAVIIGIAVGMFQFVRRSVERKQELHQQSLDQYIIDALPRFCGGRQQRNAGISVIGHYWHEVPRLENCFVRLLTGQGIYIIAEGKPESAHEYYNMERIIRLLHQIPKTQTAYDDEFKDLISELEREKSRVAAMQKSEPDKDFRVTEAQIDNWIDRLINRS